MVNIHLAQLLFLFAVDKVFFFIGNCRTDKTCDFKRETAGKDLLRIMNELMSVNSETI